MKPISRTILSDKRIFTTLRWIISAAIRTGVSGHLSSKVRVRMTKIRNIPSALTKLISVSISSEMPVGLNRRYSCRQIPENCFYPSVYAVSYIADGGLKQIQGDRFQFDKLYNFTVVQHPMRK